MEGDKLCFNFISNGQQQIVDVMESVFGINDHVVKVRGKSKVHHGKPVTGRKVEFW